MLKKMYKGLLSFIYYPIRYELLGNIFPASPTVLQFPVTNKCNSHCQMCNIWKNEEKKDISPEEIRTILKDKLFKNIQSVGLNGGEPTLRQDLPEIVNVLIESLPKFRSLNIITNSVDPKNCLDIILKINEITKKANVSFNVSISIDGIGQIHDKNRGVDGNFDSAVWLLDNLKSNNIDVWCGCTITPVNCYWVDDILNWFVEKELNYAEFRLGVDINRLNNKGFEESNSFNEEQRLHLSQFFRRLINDKSLSWVGNKEFMESLYYQLTENKSRQAGCAWKYNGITLDADGNLSFCSVSSPIIGSCLESKPSELYKNNLKIRADIIKNHCNDCKHDLVGITPLKNRLEKIHKYNLNIADKLYIKNKVNCIIKSNKTKETYISPKDWKKVLVVGWWGTETTGDKAILGGLLDFVKKQTNNQCKIAISSIDDHIVRTTFEEMEEPEPEIIDIKKCYKPNVIKDIDAVIIGGGPLEDIFETHYILAAFDEAMKQDKERILFGCGIDPKLSPRYQQIVGRLCKIASRGFLRDNESYQRGLEYGVSSDFSYSCDPAIYYIREWAKKNNTPESNCTNTIVSLLRANTTEYFKDTENLEKINKEILFKIKDVLEPKLNDSMKLKLLPMHTLCLGEDDRIYNRRLMKVFDNKEHIELERAYLKFFDVIKAIQTGDIALVTRYHGHLFCAALGIPFISVDYTGEGGKVSSFIKRINWQDYCINWGNFDPDRFDQLINNILNNKESCKNKLNEEIDKLLEQYENTLEKVFKL